MENASKALIIAGAILLAILLISLGIYIFTGAQDVTKNSGLDAQEVSVFNSAILKYEGKNKSASDVRAVKNEAIAANKKLIQKGISDDNKLIHMSMYDQGTSVNVVASEFNTAYLSDSNKKYEIKIDYDSSTGFVNKITIQ